MENKAKCHVKDDKSLSKNEIYDLKKYVDYFITNKKLDANKKVTDILRFLHSDKQNVLSGLSKEDSECATKLFNGYLNYLTENQIEDKTLGYILKLEKSVKFQDTKSKKTNNDFFDTLMKTTITNAEMSADYLIFQTKIMATALFNIEFINEYTWDCKTGGELKRELHTETNTKKSNDKLLLETQSLVTYTEALVNMRYLVNYAYLLKEYAKGETEIYFRRRKRTAGKRGGKKTSTIKRKIMGGVKNLEKYSSFWSYIQAKIGNVNGLNKENPLNNPILQADIKVFTSSQSLNERRDEFYKIYDEIIEENKKIVEENSKHANQMLSFLSKKNIINWETDKRLVTISNYEKALRKVWLSERENLKKIEEKKREIKSPELIQVIQIPKEDQDYMDRIKDESLEFNDGLIINYDPAIFTDLDINKYNEIKKKYMNTLTPEKKIVILENEIFEMESTYNKKIEDVKRESTMKNLLSHFVDYIVSEKYVGKENFELFLDLCETKLKETFVEDIDIKSQITMMPDIRISYAKGIMMSGFQKQSLEDFTSETTYANDLKIPHEYYERLKKMSEYKLLERLADESINFKEKLVRSSEETNIRVENILKEKNTKLSAFKDTKNIGVNAFYSTVGIGGLFLNTLGQTPGEKLVSFGKPIYDYGGIFVDMIVDPNYLSSSSINSIYVYMQIVMIAFICPIILQKIMPNVRDNKIVNSVIFAIQSILLIGIIYVNYNNMNYGSYLSDALLEQTACSAVYGCPTKVSGVVDYVNYISNYMGTNTINLSLGMSYFFKDMITGPAGRTILFAQWSALIGTSVRTMYTDYNSISNEHQKLFNEAETELKDVVFNYDKIIKEIEDFSEEISDKSAKNKGKLSEEMSKTLSLAQNTLQTSFSGMTAVAASRTAMATEQIANKNENKNANKLTLPNYR